jgi:hypothetical protein
LSTENAVEARDLQTIREQALRLGAHTAPDWPVPGP